MASSVISLGIQVEGEQTFTSALRNMDQQSKALSASLQQIQTSMSPFSRGLSGTVQTVQNYSQQLQIQKERLAVLSQQYQSSSQHLETLRQRLEAARQSGNPEEISRAATAYNRQAAEVARLSTEMSRTQTAANGAKNALLGMASGAIKSGISGITTGITAMVKGIQQVATAAAQVGSKVIGEMDKLVKGLAGTGVAAVAGLGKIAFDYNSQMENYVTNFGTLLGSTEAAVAKVDELKKMAAATPFGMEDLASATQTLLNFQIPADKTTTILKQLGDISMGNKEKLASLATVFGQVSSAGKLTGQDLMQFINAGFNPLNEISKKTGESMEQLRDRMSKGGITVKEVEQAFISATSAGGQFYNGMEAASKTTSGLISTLKDNAKSLVAEVFEPMSNSIRDKLLPAAIGYIEQLTTSFRERGLTGLVQSVADILGGILDTIASKGGDIISKVADGVADAVDAIASKADNFLKAGDTVIKAVFDGMNKVLPKIAELAGKVAPLVIEAIVKYKSTLLNNGILMINQIVQGMAQNLPKITQETSTLVKTLLTTLTQNLPSILKAGGDILMAVINGIRENMTQLSQTISTVMKSLIEWIVEHLDELLAAGVELLEAVAEGLIDALPTLLGKVPEIIGSLVKAFVNLMGSMVDIGRQLIEGVWKGIQNAGNWLKDKFTGFLGNIIDGVKNFLGIHSPSRVLRDEVGLMMGRGIAEGILSSGRYVQAAYDRIMPTTGRMALPADSVAVAARTISSDPTGQMAGVFQDNRPIILRLNDRELGRAVRGYV